MKLFYRTILSVLFVVLSPFAFAQYQFPDPGFEDWSGALFADSIQPAYWNFSNVSQLGIYKNFAHRATGRSGYCLLIQDQFVGVGSIGATSPGYVSLGQPWAYVSSITNINDATAGTYGGVNNWTARPDSMVVWIKRVYDSSVTKPAGDHTADEDFNLLYYAWTGTAQGGSYKAKNGTCTDISTKKPAYCVDEESDIRIALDGNECGTQTPGVQIAEGWYRERAAYQNWTKITVPIYYLSDNVPEKCNVILSAGNYPNFRANTGLNSGNSLYVDDISLVYSSKIQKLYINNREWKSFDPNNTTTEQIYSLGQGVTTIPDIYAVRGAGSLTNSKGTTATFAGRKLTASECVVTPGTVDGAVTTITVYAEDGSSTSTYRIKFVSQASNNARLSDIRVNGTTISGFNAYLNNYSIELPYGTTAVPLVEADAQDAAARVSITQPTSTSSTATIVVTAPDGTTTQTYTLTFSVAQLTDVTLQDILVDGLSIPGFSPSKANYSISLPLGTTAVPTVTPVSAYPAGAQTITILSNTLAGGCQIQVSAPGATASKTYKITYKIEASTYSYLSDLRMDGNTLPGFSAENLVYYVSLPLGTTSLPTFTWSQGDNYQSVQMDDSGISNLEGTILITVTAASGAQSVYRIVVSLEKSENNALQAIYLDGVEMANFDAETTSYAVELPIGTTVAPTITWLAGDEYQTVSITNGGLNATTRIFVTAQNGSTRIYQIAFSVATSSDATLQMIYLDGVALPDFSPAQLDYAIALPQGTTTLPTVTFDAHDEYQTISTRPATSLNGEYKIIVKPQTGASQTYTLRFSVATSSNASLAAIYLDGEPLPNFNPEVLAYSDTLPLGVSSIPLVTYAKAEAVQKVASNVNGTTVQLTVTAENGTKQVYTLQFIIQKSENAFLKMIYLDGDSLQDFDPQTLAYEVLLPDSVTAAPLITVEKNIGQKVMIAQPSLYGKASITVTPEQGGANVYQIVFSSANKQPDLPVDTTQEYIPSGNAELLAIYLDGELLAGFEPTKHQYEHLAHLTTETLPTITYLKAEEHQVVVAGQKEENVWNLMVFAEDGTSATYTLAFDYLLNGDATLYDLQLDGATIEGFSPDTTHYEITLPAGTTQWPSITLEKHAKATAVISSTCSSQLIQVYAENGTMREYSIHYTILPHTSALLTAIVLDANDSIALVDGVFEYQYTLPWHANSIPEITVTTEQPVNSILIAYKDLNEPTTITITAEDGSQAVYSIAFSSLLSGNTTLLDIQLDGVEYAFEPDQLEYTITLPQGTTVAPDFEVEKALVEQEVLIRRMPLHLPSTVEVTAEDGSKATYTYHFNVAQSAEPNVLTSIIVESIGALNMSDGPDFEVALPYGTTTANVVSYIKSFPEQDVVIQSGEYQQTIITVYSNRAGDEPTVYTITPLLPSHDPAYLTDIQVDGTSIEGFDPSVYNYVVSVNTDAPVVTYSAAPGALAYEGLTNSKYYNIEVENANYAHTYKITFFYPNDFRFDTTFDNWEAFTNDGVNSSDGNSGSIPMGWHTALSAITLDDKTPATYEPNKTCNPSDAVTTQGAYSANLATSYLFTSAEAIPGFVSLSEPTVTVGAYKIFTHTASTLSYGAPITFRNSPDKVMLDYNLEAYNRVTGWRFIYTANGDNQVNYAGDFSALSTNMWNTFASDITYGNDFVPATLDILISAAPTDDLSSYYIGASGATSSKRYTSSMYIDNLRFLYNSALTSISVNGEEATQDGLSFHATLPAEFVGLPDLLFQGEVADQGQRVTWSEEVNGVRTAAVRNYAEDGSFTDYTLVLTRPLSTVDSCAYRFDGQDLIVQALSAHQQLNITREDSIYTIHVTAESGATRQYVIRYLYPQDSLISTLPAEPYEPTFTFAEIDATPAKVLSNNTALDAILLNGAEIENFSALLTDYQLVANEAFVLEAVKAEMAQVVTAIRNDNGWTLAVTAEDGLTTAEYHIAIAEEKSSEPYLKNILLDGIQLEGFDKEQLIYSIVLPSATPKMQQPTLPDVAYVTTDTLQQVDVEWGGLGQTTYITVTAADGNTQAQYELLFEASRSSYAWLQDIQLNGESMADFAPNTFAYILHVQRAESNLQYVPGDAFQTVSLVASEWQENVKVVTIQVAAEDGTAATYTLTLIAPAASHDATLQGIYLNGSLIDGYEPNVIQYTVELQRGQATPDVSIRLADDNATASYSTTENSLTIIVTAEDGQTTLEYTVTFVQPLSSEADLQMILLDDENMPGFLADVYSYEVEVPVGASRPDVAWLKKDEYQRVDANESGNATILTVTAEDGTIHTYTIQFTFLLSQVDTLQMIYEDAINLPGFSATQFTYAFDLPVGTRFFPELSCEPGDAFQTVTVDTLQADEWHQTIRFTATAQAGTTKAYTVAYTILKSTNDTLQAIYLDNQPLPNFQGTVSTYNVVLPYGTKRFPVVDYVKGDAYQTVDTIWNANTLTFDVTAQDGSSRTYTITFTIAKSDNAQLQMIQLDSVNLAGFYQQVFTYQQTLPYGTTRYPDITWTEGDEQQTVTAQWREDTFVIVVTAGDGVTQCTYSVAFTILPSDNAALQMLLIDGVAIQDFAPDTYEYTDTLAYGTDVLPSVTWIKGDEQQTVTIDVNADVVTVTVLAGDGITSEEYVVTFVYLLSPNNYLADLQANGVTIAGFHRDSAEYHIVYPVGTKQNDLLTAAQILAIPEDADATVTLSENGEHTITIMVTAPNGDVRVYVITQEILLSPEARLSMIYLDSQELAGFDPDVLEYTLILTPGANMPDVMATPMDSLAEVEYGSFEEIQGEDYTGKFIEIDGVAENGDRLTYLVTFKYANWSATADADTTDFLFVHIPGTYQYKAVSISVGLKVAVYDVLGRLLIIEEVPVADPADVKVEVTSDGDQRLVEINPNANGVVFDVPQCNTPYFYVFFNTKNKRVAKGGKFMLAE